ncbi:jg4079 [Pararge aegeria aegeria]|uniref:Jg4079 protein n=1 Tax=Pararge aegeria aegeria TaxID=348720 RepID=A0A8S4RRR3_9NEOP|nr:jg4079 [Pararge aegeria aegeria]
MQSANSVAAAVLDRFISNIACLASGESWAGWINPAGSRTSGTTSNGMFRPTKHGDKHTRKKKKNINRIYFGECAQELFDLVPPSHFYHPTASHRKDLHGRFTAVATSFLIRTARIWNALPASIFPSSYNMSTLKSRVNRHLLGKRAPP